MDLDHILFVVSLRLLSNKIKVIRGRQTAFTMAHSVTLALSMKGIIAAPPPVIEPIISISIVFVAIEKYVAKRIKTMACDHRIFLWPCAWNGFCNF